MTESAQNPLPSPNNQSVSPQSSWPFGKLSLLPIVILVIASVLAGVFFAWKNVSQKPSLPTSSEKKLPSRPSATTSSNLPIQSSSIINTTNNDQLFFEGEILSVTGNEINVKKSLNEQNYKLKLSENTLIMKRKSLGNDTFLETPVAKTELKSGLKVEVQLKQSNKEEISKITVL